MRTKFIKGTDKQYSIREDGNIIRHYKLTWTGNKTKIKDHIMTKYGKKYSHHVTIPISGVNKSWSINTLLLEYFNFRHCTVCGKKHRIKNQLNCDRCLKETTRKYNKKTLPKKIEWAKINDRDKISRTYVAGLVKLSTSELTDELYEQYKDLLLFKRKVAKQFNVSINKFN